MKDQPSLQLCDETAFPFLEYLFEIVRGAFSHIWVASRQQRIVLSVKYGIAPLSNFPI